VWSNIVWLLFFLSVLALWILEDLDKKSKSGITDIVDPPHKKMDKTFGAGKGRKGKSKKSGTQRSASKFVPAPGEAGGIMEFSFGYDFKKHIKQVDLSKHVIPDPNEIDRREMLRTVGMRVHLKLARVHQRRLLGRLLQRLLVRLHQLVVLTLWRLIQEQFVKNAKLLH
jgi:hypothetical protein